MKYKIYGKLQRNQWNSCLKEEGKDGKRGTPTLGKSRNLQFLRFTLGYFGSFRLLSFEYVKTYFDVNQDVNQLTDFVDVKIIGFIYHHVNPFDVNSLPKKDHFKKHLLLFRVTS